MSGKAELSKVFLDGVQDVRSRMEARGVSVSGYFVEEYNRVLDGGIRQRGGDRRLFTMDVELDLEKLAGVQGGTFFAQYLHATRNSSGSHDAGDIQVYSNIETDESLDLLYEIWYQQELFDGKLRVKFGKVDANSEFAYVDVAGDFSHSSGGFSPSIFTFPTYPDPSFSVNVFGEVYASDGNSLTLGYGYYDGAATVHGIRTGHRGPSTFFSNDESADYFQILQAEWKWESWDVGGLLDGAYPGRLSIGGWFHDGDFTTFSGNDKHGTGGYYFTIEQQVCQGVTHDDQSGVFAFAQYGWSDEDVSEIAQHIGCGIVAKKIWLARPEDSFGVYVSFADLSDDPDSGYTKNETAIDVFYQFYVNETFSLQPELQYIVNPSGSKDVDDAFVVGMRLIASF